MPIFRGAGAGSSGITRSNFTFGMGHNSGLVIDPDALAWANAVTIAGGVVSELRLFLVSAYIVTLKLKGCWTILDRLWLMAAENVQQATIDLRILAVAGVATGPTFTINQGYTCSLTTWFDTNFNPSTAISPQYSTNSGHFSLYNRTNQGPSASVEMGDSDATNAFSCNLSGEWSDGNNYFALNDANGDAGRVAPVSQNGIWVVSRIGPTTASDYLAGSLFANNGQTSTNVPTFNYLVGSAFDNAGVPIGPPGTTCQFGMASLGGGMTAQNVADFTAATQTFMTAIGA